MGSHVRRVGKVRATGAALPGGTNQELPWQACGVLVGEQVCPWVFFSPLVYVWEEAVLKKEDRLGCKRHVAEGGQITGPRRM